MDMTTLSAPKLTRRLRCTCLIASCQSSYLCHQIEAFATYEFTTPTARPQEYGPLHVSSSPEDGMNFFDGYDECVEELDPDPAVIDDNIAVVPEGAKQKATGKLPQQKRHYNRSSNSLSPRRKNRQKGNNSGVATYRDTQYEMFLSNLEKDMIEGWRKQLEATRATTVSHDVTFSLPDRHFEPLDETDAALNAGTDDYTSTTTEKFLQSLSIEQLKERLREAGLPLGGNTKTVLIQRLLGKEALETEKFLAKLTVPQLKERLREAGLPVMGRKAELIDRLLGNAE